MGLRLDSEKLKKFLVDNPYNINKHSFSGTPNRGGVGVSYPIIDIKPYNVNVYKDLQVVSCNPLNSLTLWSCNNY